MSVMRLGQEKYREPRMFRVRVRVHVRNVDADHQQCLLNRQPERRRPDNRRQARPVSQGIQDPA